MTPATWYVAVGGNDVAWRATFPAGAVGAQVSVIREDQANRITEPQRFAWPGEFSWMQRPDDLACYPHHKGVAVWVRPCLARGYHMAAMQQLGIRTVAEVDDNYLSAPHLNLFMRVNRYGAEGRAEHLKAMAVADAVVFSTAWLRDRYVKAFKRELGHKAETHVCRNHLPAGEWPVRDEGDGRLRVGWMGSPQHARDLKHAYQAFAVAKAEGCETVLMGHDVRDEFGVTNPRALDACRAWRSVITRHIPWRKPEDYHRTALPLDIGLAPLEMNDHTLGKSDVKAVEIAASGAVPVLAAHPVYAKHWRHNETCLLASSPAEFTGCVQELIRSPRLRERLVTAAQAYVREERGDRQLREEWGSALGG